MAGKVSIKYKLEGRMHLTSQDGISKQVRKGRTEEPSGESWGECGCLRHRDIRKGNSVSAERHTVWQEASSGSCDGMREGCGR